MLLKTCIKKFSNYLSNKLRKQTRVKHLKARTHVPLCFNKMLANTKIFEEGGGGGKKVTDRTALIINTMPQLIFAQSLAFFYYCSLL